MTSPGQDGQHDWLGRVNHDLVLMLKTNNCRGTAYVTHKTTADVSRARQCHSSGQAIAKVVSQQLGNRQNKHSCAVCY